MTPSWKNIRRAATILDEMGIGLAGYDAQGDRFTLPTPEAVVLYLQADKARHDLCELLPHDELAFRLEPKGPKDTE